MYEPGKEAQELERAVNQLGFCGGLVNDFPSIEGGSGRKNYDTAKYDLFWTRIEDSDDPIHFDPMHMSVKDLILTLGLCMDTGLIFKVQL